MAKEIRTIGVLTSGGDAPGMNAAIRAVVRKAIASGKKVMGIEKGYRGLLDEEIYEMSPRDVSDSIQRGGTILRTVQDDTGQFRRRPHTTGEIISQRSIQASRKTFCSPCIALL